MKKVTSLLLASTLIATSIFGAGCATNTVQTKENTSQVEDVRVVKHAGGETEIKGIPKRIVVLEIALADALAALDVQAVGIADDSDPKLVIDEIKNKVGDYTSVGSRYEVNLEKISSLKPDLILADQIKQNAVLGELKKIAPTVTVDSYNGGYKESLDAVKIIADAVGKSDKIEGILKKHNEAILKYKEQIPKDEKRTILPAVVTKSGFHAHADHSYVGTFLSELGLKDPLKAKDAYNKLSIEQVVEINPDVMYFMVSEEVTIINEWKNNPLWQNLKAVKENKVFYVSRPKWAVSRGLISSEVIAKDIVETLYKR